MREVREVRQRGVREGMGPLKEWQRWERMALDFSTSGDSHRAAQALEMALELLPPGHKDDKTRLREALEEVKTRTVEHGLEDLGPEAVPEALLEARESLEPEGAREAVLRTVRHMTRTIEGVEEEAVARRVEEGSGLEHDLVLEAVEDLLDEGQLFRPRHGYLMVDGPVSDEDVETAVLSVLSDLSAGGGGGSREEVVQRLIDRGFARDQVEQAIDGLEETGRLDEGHPGRLRQALGTEEIMEAHRHILAAIEDMDPAGEGVLETRMEHELAGRGWELAEVRTALDDLVDTGDVIRRGGEVRLAMAMEPDPKVRDELLGALRDMAGASRRPVPLVRALRLARNLGVSTAQAHRVIDSMVDGGLLWRDDRGLHLERPTEVEQGSVRHEVIAAVRALGHGHQGAPRLEVIDLAMSRGGVEEGEARRVLEDLIDEGIVHDTGGGFLRPG